jgi:hypothetical protein
VLVTAIGHGGEGPTMRMNRDELPILFGDDSAGIRGDDWGGQRVMFIKLPAGTDLKPFLGGLPNDLCPCPHWGYIMKGRIRLSYSDSEETLQAGDLFYLPPGHTPFVEEDCEFVEFSPPAEHQHVLDVISSNIAASSAA